LNLDQRRNLPEGSRPAANKFYRDSHLSVPNKATSRRDTETNYDGNGPEMSSAQ